mmetsp:Transcript_30205/g.87977  ORF Transcript_30205/g.87977 Transcript_30205/m.87977 type:complete len:220 (+) Transcript_30205:1226-1885(+)
MLLSLAPVLRFRALDGTSRTSLGHMVSPSARKVRVRMDWHTEAATLSSLRVMDSSTLRCSICMVRISSARFVCSSILLARSSWSSFKCRSAMFASALASVALSSAARCLSLASCSRDSSSSADRPDGALPCLRDSSSCSSADTSSLALSFCCSRSRAWSLACLRSRSFSAISWACSCSSRRRSSSASEIFAAKPFCMRSISPRSSASRWASSCSWACRS